jgi:hypothetical protein
MARPRINDFLAGFSGESKFCLSLPFFWSVVLDGPTRGNINNVLESAGESWRANNDPANMAKNGNLLVAQEVTLPSESSTFLQQSMGTSTGGFLPTYAMDTRSDFLSRSFNINFIETKNDIEHDYFRPWMIALGIQGLIAKGQPLKATVTVQQYTNDGKLRKGYKFDKVFPTNIEGYTLNYENSEFTVKTVTFACYNYSQISVQT